MDCAVLLPWLSFKDLIALYQTSKFWQYWVNENLTYVVNRYSLSSQKTFDKLLTAKRYAPPLESYQENRLADEARAIIETRVYDFFVQRVDLRLLVEIPELMTEYGVSSQLQYRLDKKYYFVDAQALLRGLPFVSKLSTLKFFLSKLGSRQHATQLRTALFELAHNAMHSASYKILLYLLQMRFLMGMQFCDERTEVFLQEHAPEFNLKYNKKCIQLVADQCSCTELDCF